MANSIFCSQTKSFTNEICCLMRCPKGRLLFLAGRRPTQCGIRKLVLAPATMALEWTSSLQQALTRLTCTALQLAMVPITTALQLCQGLMQTALQQIMKLLLAALQHQLEFMQTQSKYPRSVLTMSRLLYSTLLPHACTYLAMALCKQHCCSSSVGYHACQLQLRVHKECFSGPLSAKLFKNELPQIHYCHLPPPMWTKSGAVQLLLFCAQLTGQLHLRAHNEAKAKSWIS